ncbi:hypothetical protein R70006_04997 [Paraburkholderia domus]|uniref:hypothetical protein n=1 Tax=Paraburkholderia domus TaxID=2793075 RepID=UPI0019123B67|nr:hypothetical protein [Paraburkholderia domus]MBK5051767.1 hypothetical protein [Burkholderia sp. R-70006]CAE6794289.1 hypothetical protein R70006_04997 [Paraburkholderia domus]
MTTEQTNGFDAEEQRRQEESLADIKRSNIRNVLFQGKGRVAVLTVGGTFVILMLLGLYRLSHSSDAPQAAAPVGAAPNTGGVQGDAMVASQREAELRRQANAQAASEAAANHTPYMASPVLQASGTQDVAGGEWGGFGAGAPVHASQPAVQAPDAASNPANANYSASPGQVPTAKSAVDVRSIASTLGASEGDVTSQINSVLGASPSNPTGGSRRRSFTVGYYPLPSQESSAQSSGLLNGSGVGGIGAPSSLTSAAQASADKQTKEVIPGWTLGQAFYCKIKYGANSDLVRRDVFADCYGGVADGAKFYGKAEPSAEGVSDPGFTVTFSSVYIPKLGTYPVQAIAYTNETLEASVDDSVNEHSIVKFTELGIAGLLKGIGQAAQIVTGSSNTQTIGNVSTTSVNVTAPTLAQIAESAAGGVGAAIGDTVQKRAEALKTTIKIFPNKDIGIVLTSDVTYQKQ